MLKIKLMSDNLLMIKSFNAALLITILLSKFPINKKLEKPINCHPKNN